MCFQAILEKNTDSPYFGKFVPFGQVVTHIKRFGCVASTDAEYL
jgi:predicted RNase H-like HicB family nuclease